MFQAAWIIRTSRVPVFRSRRGARHGKAGGRIIDRCEGRRRAGVAKGRAPEPCEPWLFKVLAEEPGSHKMGSRPSSRKVRGRRGAGFTAALSACGQGETSHRAILKVCARSAPVSML